MTGTDDNSRRRWRALALVLIVLCNAAQASPAVQPGGPPPQFGSLLLETDFGPQPAVLLDTDVSIHVNGLVARVSVMQRFENTGTETLEGVYLFPLPETAAVDRMRLYIGDRFIEGEIREKAHARRDYEQARREGRKASLVEEHRANAFSTSIATISPGETVIVEIEYLEEVRFDAGQFSLRFPMTITPRYDPANGHAAAAGMRPDAEDPNPPLAAQSEGHRVALRASINAGVSLARVASRYHPVNVSEAGGRYLLTLAAGRVPMDRDFELVWKPAPAAQPRALVFSEAGAGRMHTLLMVMPPAVPDEALPPAPREVILIIDTSGSMHGDSLEQAKRAVTLALERLAAADHFNVIAFSDSARAVFPRSVAADPVNVGVARTFVANLSSSGGTEMYPALELALGTRPPPAYLRQLVFVTDGAVNNEEALFGLIRERLGDARLFTVGIGSAPNSWFMRKAAETGRGTFTFVGSLDQVGVAMDRLLRKLERPQLTDIDIAWPSGIVVETYPATVPDLYSGEPVAVRARIGAGLRPGDTVRVTGNSTAGAWLRDVALETGFRSEGVGALWARARIAALLDAGSRGADAGEMRRQIVETALAHHLVSPFTSLVAVDRTPVPAGAVPARREAIASLRPRGQSRMAFIGLPGTATDAPALLASGAAVTGAALLFAALLAISGRRTRVFAH